MPKSTKKSKTKEPEQTAVLEETLPVVPNDPVVERLDIIIGLLSNLSNDTKQIPFKGIDFDKWKI